MKIRDKLILCTGVLGYFIWSFFILLRDKLSPLHDASICYYTAVNYFYHLPENLKILFNNLNGYPPLYMLITLPFFKIFGVNPDVMALLNIGYYFILLFSLYKINQRLNESGIFSLIIVASFPVIIGYFRVTHLTVAMTAIFSLWMYFILESEGFSNRKFSFISGFILGFGLLISYHFLCYALGPLVIYFFYVLKKRSCLLNFLQSMAISLVIMSLWYLPAFFLSDLKNILIIQCSSSLKFFGQSSYLERLFANINFLFKLVSLPYAVIFLIGMVAIFISKSSKKNIFLYATFLGWFLTSLVIISLFKIMPNIRYLLPILPSMAIIIAILIKELFNKRYSFYFLIFLCSAALFIFFKYQHQNPQDSYQLLIDRNDYGVLKSYSFDSKISDFLKFLKDRGVKKPTTMVVITSDDLNPAPICLDLLNYGLEKEKLPIRYYNAGRISLRKLSFEDRERLIENIYKNAKYILYVKNKKHLPTPRADYKPWVNRKLKQLFAESDKKLIGVFKDPNEFFIDEFWLYELIKKDDH